MGNEFFNILNVLRAQLSHFSSSKTLASASPRWPLCPCPARRLCVAQRTHTGDLAVDLGSILALRVGVLGRGHLQHAHPKGVHVHRLVIVLLVHLRGHELGGPCAQEQWTQGQWSPLLTTSLPTPPTGWPCPVLPTSPRTWDANRSTLKFPQTLLIPGQVGSQGWEPHKLPAATVLGHYCQGSGLTEVWGASHPRVGLSTRLLPRA